MLETYVAELDYIVSDLRQTATICANFLLGLLDFPVGSLLIIFIYKLVFNKICLLGNNYFIDGKVKGEFENGLIPLIWWVERNGKNYIT